MPSHVIMVRDFNFSWINWDTNMSQGHNDLNVALTICDDSPAPIFVLSLIFNLLEEEIVWRFWMVAVSRNMVSNSNEND